MNNVLLQINNLQVNFDVLRGNKKEVIHAVQDVSFTLNKGEILGIVGESGSGKSVTTSCISGLLPSNANPTGTIFYKDVDLLKLKQEGKKSFEKLREYRGKKIGMIFQEPGRSFDPLQNIFSVFYETFKNSYPKITKNEAQKKATELLKETGIENAERRLKNFPHQFSGGQLQRIGIALALAQECELLIADEPTTALDVTIQAQIIDLLLTLRKKHNIAIIFISHNIDLVAQISDRILVMYSGFVLESGDAKKLYNNPLHPYTKALLSSSPSFGSHYSKSPLTPIPGKVTDPAHPELGCPFYPRCFVAKQNPSLDCSTNLPKIKTKSLSDNNTEELRQVRCCYEKL